MSVIQRIRDKGAWIIFSIIAIALISFILQDGLGRRGSLFSNTSTVGKVNGQAIEKEDFEKKIELYGKNQPREQLIPQLWNQEVNTILQQQEYDKLGLKCTNKELSEVMFGENSPLKREFTDPKTGIFNAEQARNAFDQLKKSKKVDQQQLEQIAEAYIKPTIQQTLQQKYQSILTQSSYAPKWLIEKQKAEAGSIAAVSYVYVPYSSVSDSAVKVNDDEIVAYANKHKKEFEKDEETRGISFVTFDVAPTAADSAVTKTQLETIKPELVASKDMKNFFAKTSSEMQFYDSYISKNEIKQPVKDSLFKLAPGATYGPYADGNNFVIAKMVDSKSWPDSAKVRHILVATHQQDPQTGQQVRTRDDSTARKRMDTVEAMLRSGANFDSVCAKYSDDGNKDKGGIYDYFITSRMVASFNDFAFGKPVGSKGTVETEYGLHYVEVLGQKGSAPAYKIAYLSRPINVSNETVNAVSTAAAQFAATSKTKEAFDANAKKLNKSATPANELKENEGNIPGLSSARQIVRWVYEHKVGDVSEQPFEVNAGVNSNKLVVAIVTAVNKPGIPSAQTLRPQVESFVKNEKKAKQIIDSKFKGSSLEAIASASGAQVQKADSLSFANAFVPGIGNDNKFLGLAFNKDIKGKASEAIAGSTGVFSVRVENVGTKPTTESDDNIKQQILQGIRMAVYRGSEALKKDASIKDNRSKFY